MAAGSIAAGLVDGYVRGLGLRRRMNEEDEAKKDREAERAYRNEQRELLRRDRAADDEIDRRLSAVPTTTEKWGQDYEWAAKNNYPVTRDDEGNVLPGVTSTPRAYRDVAADQAAAVRGLGRRGVSTANQLQQFVNSEDDRREAGIDRERTRKLGDLQFSNAEIANRQARVGEGLKLADYLLRNGRVQEAAQALQSSYELYPDGQKLVLGDGKMGVATAFNKMVEPMVPITPESVASAINYGMRLNNPTAWAQLEQVRQGDQRITNDSTHQKGMLGYYTGRLGLERDEFNARKSGGMFTRPPTAADNFTPIGLSDDGKRILGRQGGGVREVPVPDGYTSLFPKVTGDKGARPARFLKGEDGTHTAYGEDGRPLYNVLNGGLEAPVGMDNTTWGRMQKDASKAGVRAALGKGADGAPMVAFIGRDGRPYSTLEEAIAAKPVTK
jgi:hypothetical protein